MKRIWAQDVDCREMRSVGESCAVCMRMRNEQKVKRTFQADCPQYLHGPVSVYPSHSPHLPMPPISDAPAPARCARLSPQWGREMTAAHDVPGRRPGDVVWSNNEGLVSRAAQRRVKDRIQWFIVGKAHLTVMCTLACAGPEK